MTRDANHDIKVRSYNDCRLLIASQPPAPDGSERTAKYLTRDVAVVRSMNSAIGPRPIYSIMFRHTPVLIYYADGTFSADNGGFNTPSTTNTMNRYGPPGWHFFHRKRKLFGQHADDEPETAHIMSHQKRYYCPIASSYSQT